MSKDPFEKIFGDFRRDLEKYTKETPRIFEKVAKEGAREFVNEAMNITDEEDLFDTGDYKRNWFAEAYTKDDENFVYCENSVEYASHLEWGHKIKGKKTKTKGYFVGQRAKDKAQFYCVEELQDALNKLMKKKK